MNSYNLVSKTCPSSNSMQTFQNFKSVAEAVEVGLKAGFPKEEFEVVDTHNHQCVVKFTCSNENDLLF